jgi:uncharacterized protein YutE (UPF0331/DUF86 family)
MISIDAQQGQDPVILSIILRLERYVARVHEEYNKDPATFANDITRQEAAIMNIVRAVAAALDIGEHIIRKHQLGTPKSQLDVIDRIATAGFITVEVADSLTQMITFKNAALHQPLDLKSAQLEQLISSNCVFCYLTTLYLHQYATKAKHKIL